MSSNAFKVLLDEAWDLHVNKSKGYSPGADPWKNFRAIEEAGISATDGCLTRMSDKWSRLISLWKQPENDTVGENIRDTLMDLAAYSYILICLLEEPTLDKFSEIVYTRDSGLTLIKGEKK